MKTFLILFLLISSVCSADTDTAMCEKEALKFGDGSGKDSIPAECADHFLKKVSPKLKKVSNDGSVIVYAYKNIIFVKDPNSKVKGQNVIAGKYTELENIQAITLDEANKEIVVLEENQDILSFSSVITGNVAPKRILKHKELEDASDLLVYKKHIIVLADKNDEIIFFNREANVHAPEEKKFLSPVRTIRNISGSQMHVNDESEELLVVDQQKRSQSIFDLKTMKYLRTETIPEFTNR